MQAPTTELACEHSCQALTVALRCHGAWLALQLQHCVQLSAAPCTTLARVAKQAHYPKLLQRSSPHRRGSPQIAVWYIVCQWLACLRSPCANTFMVVPRFAEAHGSPSFVHVITHFILPSALGWIFWNSGLRPACVVRCTLSIMWHGAVPTHAEPCFCSVVASPASAFIPARARQVKPYYGNQRPPHLRVCASSI